MARRKQSALEALVTLPWPAGIAAGILGFLAIRHGIAWWMGQSGGPLGQAFAQQAPAFAPIAWTVLALCWRAALASWLDRRKRRLLDTRTGLDSLAALGWVIARLVHAAELQRTVQLSSFHPHPGDHRTFRWISHIAPSLSGSTPNLSQSTIAIHRVTS